MLYYTARKTFKKLSNGPDGCQPSHVEQQTLPLSRWKLDKQLTVDSREKREEHHDPTQTRTLR